MKATISFELVDKEMGKKGIQLIESVASPKAVVGFADPDDISFFIDCDWVTGDVYDDKVLVASESIDEDKFNGNIW